jgi:hypothetical protein
MVHGKVQMKFKFQISNIKTFDIDSFWNSFDICLPALPTGRQAQVGILTFELFLTFEDLFRI